MLMLRMRVSGFAVVAVLGAVARLWAPGMGHAQTLDIGGHVGLYAPVGPLIDGGSSADGTSLPQKRLLMAGLVGADAVVWAATRFGFIASVAYAPSSVALTNSSGTTDHVGSVILASARVVFAFTRLTVGPDVVTGRRNTPWSFYVGTGAGLASRGGAVWAYSTGRASPAVVLNVGARTPLGPRSLMRLELEDYVSRARFDKGLPGETPARWHHDVVVALSFAFRAVR